MTIPFTTSKAEGLLVKVPDNYGDFIYVEEKDDEENTWFSDKLPEGNWKLIGSPFEITEEQAREIVDNSIKHPSRYADYQFPDSACWDALESWNSLLKSLLIFQANPRHKPKESDYDIENSTNDTTRYVKEKEAWERAQERTGNYVLLLKEKG